MYYEGQFEGTKEQWVSQFVVMLRPSSGNEIQLEGGHVSGG